MTDDRFSYAPQNDAKTTKRIAVSGGAGFLGKRLAKQLLQRGVLKNAQGVEEKIDELLRSPEVQRDLAGETGSDEQD